MSKALLFCYGKLQSGYEPPESMSSHTRDAVRGFMFVRGDNDPALIEPGFAHHPWCWGELMSVDEEELASIDESEEGYLRQKITTFHGYRAWIYVYTSAPPPGAVRINRWEGT